jgi:hypothetical protein
MSSSVHLCQITALDLSYGWKKREEKEDIRSIIHLETIAHFSINIEDITEKEIEKTRKIK